MSVIRGISGLGRVPRRLSWVSQDGTRSSHNSISDIAKDFYTNKEKKNKKKEKEDQDKKESSYPPKEEDMPPEMKPYSEYGKDGTTQTEPPRLGDEASGGDETSGDDEKGWTLYYNSTQQGMSIMLTDAYSGLSDKFHIIKVNDNLSTKLPTAPLENGMVKHDHKVNEPITLQIMGWVKRKDKNLVESCFKEARKETSLDGYFSLDSPWKYYPRMYLQKYSSTASSEKYDVYEYSISLQELLLAENVTDTTDDASLVSNTQKGAASSHRTRRE